MLRIQEITKGDKMSENIKDEFLVKVDNLSVGFQINKKEYVEALDGLSFEVKEGEVLGIVGESGSGKSISVTSIMGLLPPNAKITSGEIIFNNKNLLTLSEKEMSKIRGNEMSMIFQDPMTSLNPVYTVENQLVEALRLHNDITKEAAQKRSIELLEMVGIQEAQRRVKLYPHEFSGGMRQRVMIAMAVACNPKLIIADEPTTALDVTVQAQILDLLKDMQKKLNTGVIFITHDLEVIADIAHRVIIMYAGQVVEMGSVDVIFKKPMHPYTKMLIQSIPKSNKKHGRLKAIEGSVPLLKDIKKDSCRFANRIPWIADSEHEHNPKLREVEPGHFVRCTCYKNFRYKDE